MAQVVLKNVSKRFDAGVQAVRDVTLTVVDREFVVLVGPSGCGKSTTLRMIAGLEEVSGGEIFIGDRCVNDVPPKDRDIAMVFQNYALYPHMTVYDNMAFGLKLRKLPKAEIQQRVAEAAEILGIPDLLHRKPRALSGGQRQRVAVGRAIVRKPQVFLFDEPLSNLDAKLRVQMRAELKKLHERLQATIVYVTHDQVEAMTMGDRIVILKDGAVQQVGEPLGVYERPANQFVAGFIGSPAMNFLPVGVAGGDAAPALEGPGFRLAVAPEHAPRVGPYRGRRLVLGIRPEDLRPAAPTDPADGVIEGPITVVEPVGSDQFLEVDLQGVPLIARVDARLRLRAHQRIRLAPSPGKIHLFDPATEQALLS